jgi:hypothetical protein
MRWRLPLMLATAVGVSLAPTRSDAQGQNVALMRQLESTDWRRRAAAFAAIDRDPHAWEQPRSALSLLNLVEREDALQKETLLSSNGAVGVSDRFGEEYSEYAARAMDECLRFCDRDKLLTMIVSDVRSGPTRQSAIELLGNAYKRFWTSPNQRLRVDSALVTATRDSSSWFVRAAAVSALSAPLHAWNDLPTQEKDLIRTAIVAAARDSSGPVRGSAVRRLGELEEVGDRSPSSAPNPGAPRQLVELRLVRDSLVPQRDGGTVEASVQFIVRNVSNETVYRNTSCGTSPRYWVERLEVDSTGHNEWREVFSATCTGDWPRPLLPGDSTTFSSEIVSFPGYWPPFAFSNEANVYRFVFVVATSSAPGAPDIKLVSPQVVIRAPK